MGNPKVSVLFPIFGVEKFIRHCASSLFSQTLKDDIEFIFVNDSTKDSSMQILNEVISEFPERQKQIKIINHDGNKGLAAVRKTAVLAAKGDYVIHCDSDDRVEPDIYETMYKTAVNKNADIVICNFFEERANGSHVIKQSLADSCLEIVRPICLYFRRFSHYDTNAFMYRKCSFGTKTSLPLQQNKFRFNDPRKIIKKN